MPRGAAAPGWPTTIEAGGDMASEQRYPEGGPGPVRRLQIRWQQGEYRIVGDVRVDEMTIPAHDELPADRVAAELSGSWFEVRDGAEGVLYRQRFANPISGGDELFERSGSIRRVDVEHTDTVFELLVPDVPDAQELVLVGLPPGGERGSRSRREDRVAAVLDLRNPQAGGRSRRGNR